MNYAKHGCLLRLLIKKKIGLNEAEARTIMIQLLLSVDFMHRKGIVHRDLKLENILLLDNESLNVCLADLGMACTIDNFEALKQKCGTPGFVAPEILNGGQASTKSDVFSLGSIFYSLLTSMMVFKGRNANEILSRNKRINPKMVV